MYSSGTKEAISFIEKYKKSGYLVDFYSEEYISTLNPELAQITIEDLKKYDSVYGTTYRGHMLPIFIGNENSELINDLEKLYKPFKDLFNLEGIGGGWLHKPDFLIINLITKEILCVGLGRKNNCFKFELHKYLSLRTDGNGKQTLKYSNESDYCSEEFFRYDHFSIAEKTIESTEALGKAYKEHDELPGNSEVYVERNKRDGLYYLVDFEDTDGMTKAEVKNLEDEYRFCSNKVKVNFFELNQFFPKFNEQWDLNTGDY